MTSWQGWSKHGLERNDKSARGYFMIEIEVSGKVDPGGLVLDLGHTQLQQFV